MTVRYDFPKNNPTPFDLEFKGNYFVYASGYSNLTDNLDDFSFEHLKENIPLGYKTIIVCHRLIAIDNGKIINVLDKEALENISTGIDKYLISSDKIHKRFMKDWNREIDSEAIFKPDSTDGTLTACEWSNLEECKSFALEFSETTNCKLLISRVHKDIFWH